MNDEIKPLNIFEGFTGKELVEISKELTKSDGLECSGCKKELDENDQDVLTDDDDRCYCNQKCYTDYISGWEDYMQTLGE